MWISFMRKSAPFARVGAGKSGLETHTPHAMRHRRRCVQSGMGFDEWPPEHRRDRAGARRWRILGFEIERKFLAQGDSGRGGKGARIRQADLRGDGKDWSLVRPAGQV